MDFSPICAAADKLMRVRSLTQESEHIELGRLPPLAQCLKVSFMLQLTRKKAKKNKKQKRISRLTRSGSIRKIRLYTRRFIYNPYQKFVGFVFSFFVLFCFVHFHSSTGTLTLAQTFLFFTQIAAGF